MVQFTCLVPNIREKLPLRGNDECNARINRTQLLVLHVGVTVAA